MRAYVSLQAKTYATSLALTLTLSNVSLESVSEFRCCDQTGWGGGEPRVKRQAGLKAPC